MVKWRLYYVLGSEQYKKDMPALRLKIAAYRKKE
jgi:hypothetical protein